MTEKNIKDLVHLATGKWSGPERITVDPSKGRTIEALGRFEATPALAGTGFRSSYSQTINGAPGTACETVYRFGDDDEITMVWVPADGAPRIMHGHRVGAVLTVSHTDDSGMVHRLVSDYSQMGVATVSMTIGTSDGDAMPVFTGRYARVGTDEGGAA